MLLLLMGVVDVGGGEAGWGGGVVEGSIGGAANTHTHAHGHAHNDATKRTKQRHTRANS